jgi:hypothetical protein
MNDIQFEAAYLRAALLVGLVDEREVPAWAIDRSTSSDEAASRLTDVMLAPTELTAMREALRPLGERVADHRVAPALLVAVAVEHAAGGRPTADCLRILAHIRREFPLDAHVSASIKEFEDRSMLAAAGMRGERAPTSEEIEAWLDTVRSDGYFRFVFVNIDEAAAFVAAVSRRVTRDRPWSEQPGRMAARAWVLHEPGEQVYIVYLNESAWLTAVREFSPIPLGSRIATLTLPVDALEVMDESTTTGIGVDDVLERLAT